MIPEETAETLSQPMVQQELETMSKAVTYAVESAHPTDDLSDAELAHLLHQRLRSPESHS